MKKVYFSYVCGFASLCDFETDIIVHSLKGKRSIEQHLEKAKEVAASKGWTLK